MGSYCLPTSFSHEYGSSARIFRAPFLISFSLSGFFLPTPKQVLGIIEASPTPLLFYPRNLTPTRSPNVLPRTSSILCNTSKAGLTLCLLLLAVARSAFGQACYSINLPRFRLQPVCFILHFPFVPLSFPSRHFDSPGSGSNVCFCPTHRAQFLHYCTTFLAFCCAFCMVLDHPSGSSGSLGGAW